METVEKKSMKQKVNNVLGANPVDARFSIALFTVAFIAFFIGGVLGLLQGLNRAGIFELPAWLNYYQVLTAHGYLLVLVFRAHFQLDTSTAALSHTLRGATSEG